MEEFVCKAKNNLVLLVKYRIEKKYSVKIDFGEILVDDEEQWIMITGGTLAQRQEAKNYVTTLCNSEDACILSYDEKYHQHLQKLHAELEENSGACLVFPQPGTVNIYGNDMNVTLALTALEDLKDRLAKRDKPPEIPEDELNEKLKVKCREHDLMFEDYMNASMTVKRTLFRWLSQDMDKSNSLVEDLSDDGLDETDAVIVRDVTSPVREMTQNLDLTLREADVTDPRVKVILSHGYTAAEFDAVRNEIGNNAGISTLLTKLLENRQKNALLGIEPMDQSTSDRVPVPRSQKASDRVPEPRSQKASDRVPEPTSQKASDRVPEPRSQKASDRVPEPRPQKKKVTSDLIDLTDDNTDLMVYFEDFFEEEPNLSREEYLKRNLNRQKLLLAEVEKRSNANTTQKVESASSGETPSKKKKKGKRRRKKKRKNSQQQTGASTSRKSSSSEEDGDEDGDDGDEDEEWTVIDSPPQSRYQTLDKTGQFLNQSQSSTLADVTVVANTPGRPLPSPAGAALYRTMDETGPDLTLVNTLNLLHSPMAENSGKKKQRTEPNKTLDSSFNRDIGQDLSAVLGWPMHSTPLSEVNRTRLGARFDNCLSQVPNEAREARPICGRRGRSKSRDRGSPHRGSPQRGSPPGPSRAYEVRPEEARVPLPMSDVPRPVRSHLRPIVIDGSNVACAHGRNKVFSSRGILYAVEHFKKLGHDEITVFVPNWRKGGINAKLPTVDSDILIKLEEQRILSFTPSRYLNGKKHVCYDDRFIIELAAENEGVVVSNDNFRDLVNEKPAWKHVIETRLLMYTFAGDRFMVPDDPLGPHGPSLNFMLTRSDHTRQSVLNRRKKSAASGGGMLGPAPGAPGPSWSAPMRQSAVPAPMRQSAAPAPGGPGPARGHDARPTHSRAKPPACRPQAQTEALYRQLLELFPTVPSLVQRILDNHMNETDVNKLTLHILDVIQ